MVCSKCPYLSQKTINDIMDQNICRLFCEKCDKHLCNSCSKLEEWFDWCYCEICNKHVCPECNRFGEIRQGDDMDRIYWCRDCQ